MLYVLLWLVAVSPIGTRGTLRSKNVPHLLNYSGFLTNSSDTTPVNGNLTMTFSLWSEATGGTQYWSETHSSVPVVDGYFHVVLGSVNPLPANLFNGRKLYLQIQVGSEILSPRKHLVSVGHAFHSLQSDTANFAFSALSAGASSRADTANFALRADVATNAQNASNASHSIRADTALIALYAHHADTAAFAAGADLANSATHAQTADLATHAQTADTAQYALATDTLLTNQKYLFRNRPDSTRISAPSGPGLLIRRTGNGLYGITGLKVSVSNGLPGATYSGYFEGPVKILGNLEIDSSGMRVLHANNYGLNVVSADSEGVHVGTVQNGAGLVVDNAYGGAWVGTGLRINYAEDDGIDIRHAGYWGLYLGTTANDGIFISEAGTNGLYVKHANDNGLTIDSAGQGGVQIGTVQNGPGIVIDSAKGYTGDGLRVNYAAGTGVYVKTAPYGVLVDSAGYQGMYVLNAGDDAFEVGGAHNDGLGILSTGRHGVHVWDVPQNAVQVDYAGNVGMVIHRADSGGIFVGSANNYGIEVDSAKGLFSDGVHVRYANFSGFSVSKAGFSGLFVDKTGAYGAYIDSAGWQGLYVRKAEKEGVYVGQAKRGMTINQADSGGIYIGNIAHGPAIYINAVEDGYNGITINSAEDGVRIRNAWDNGITVEDASVYGVVVGDAGLDGFSVDHAGQAGLSVWEAGQEGLLVDSAGWFGVYAEGAKYGGVFVSDTAGFDYPTLYVENTHGATSDEYLAVFAADTGTSGWSPPATKFYFRADGNAYADGGWHTFKRDSKGEYESFSAIEAERQEIVAHGKAKLVNGEARITFPRSFSEFVSSREEITVTVTPKSWSGLYVPEVTTQGFVVKSGAGDPNAEFDWIAIGVEKGKETRPTLPNIAEEDRIRGEMLAKRRAERKARMRAHRENRPKFHNPPAPPTPEKPAQLVKARQADEARVRAMQKQARQLQAEKNRKLQQLRSQREQARQKDATLEQRRLRHRHLKKAKQPPTAPPSKP